MSPRRWPAAGQWFPPCHHHHNDYDPPLPPHTLEGFAPGKIHCATVHFDTTHSFLAMQYNRSQGSSPGGSEDSNASDVDVGAEDDREYHKTSLHTACAQGYAKRVQKLLDQEDDLNRFEWPVSV